MNTFILSCKNKFTFKFQIKAKTPCTFWHMKGHDLHFLSRDSTFFIQILGYLRIYFLQENCTNQPKFCIRYIESRLLYDTVLEMKHGEVS